MKRLLITTVFAMVILPLRAFVLSRLWLWFVVPTFNVPAIGLWSMLGIVLGIFTFYPNKPDDKITIAALSDAFVGKLTELLLVLGIGALVRVAL